MDLSKSLLTYQPELLWPNCRLTCILLHVALLLIQPFLGFYIKHCCSITSYTCEYNWYDDVQFNANLKLPTYLNILITIFIIQKSHFIIITEKKIHKTSCFSGILKLDIASNKIIKLSVFKHLQTALSNLKVLTT